MNAYIYQADIYCEECAQEIMARLRKPLEEQAEAEVDIQLERLEKELEIDLDDSPKMRERLIAKRTKALVPDTDDESSYDSSEYPKGPYSDGGGEADTPQHCGACSEFLENPLTSDGLQYVQDKKCDQWDAFYGIDRDDQSA